MFPRLILFLLTITFISCADFSNIPNDDNGYYDSPTNTITDSIPSNNVSNFTGNFSNIPNDNNGYYNPPSNNVSNSTPSVYRPVSNTLPASSSNTSGWKAQDISPTSNLIDVSNLPDSQERWILSVGVSKYLDRNITSLNYCHKDAQSIVEYFRDNGVPASNIKLLINEQATKENILSAIEKIKQTMFSQGKTGGKLIFFISGHGAPDPDPNKPNTHYFMTTDTIQEDPSSAIPMQEIKDKLGKLPVKEAILLVDTCHSGGAKSGSFKEESMEQTLKVAVLSGPKNVKLAVLSSSRTYEKSREDEKWEHGAFTYSMIRGWNGMADTNKDGTITVAELTDFVEIDVRGLTERSQHPTSHFSGHWNPQSIFGKSLGIFTQPSTPIVDSSARNTNSSPNIIGFTFLRTQTYKCGKITKTVAEYRHDFTGMEFVLIPGGTFMMGSENGDSDEKPVHKVTLSPYLISKTEVPQSVWQKVMGNNPSNFKGDNRPVEQVSWNDCLEFLNKADLQFPTEAQWEFACRAGSDGEYCYGDGDAQLARYACFSRSSTQDVAQTKPNAFGLYDMHGNVWEWCADWFSNYSSGDVIDPTGPKSGSLRVLRGGGWNLDSSDCRSADRSDNAPGDRNDNLGFRVCASSD